MAEHPTHFVDRDESCSGYIECPVCGSITLEYLDPEEVDSQGEDLKLSGYEEDRPFKPNFRCDKGHLFWVYTEDGVTSWKDSMYSDELEYEGDEWKDIPDYNKETGEDGHGHNKYVIFAPVKEANMGEDNPIKGGKGDELSPHDVDPYQLGLGGAVEMEHTDDPFEAVDIALDHIAESDDPMESEYYTELLNMEEELEAKEANVGSYEHSDTEPLEVGIDDVVHDEVNESREERMSEYEGLYHNESASLDWADVGEMIGLEDMTRQGKRRMNPRKLLREMIKKHLASQRKPGEMVSEASMKKLNVAFKAYVCSKDPRKVLSDLSRERAGEMRDMCAEWTAMGMNLKGEILVKGAGLLVDQFEDSVKDLYWNEFITEAANSRRTENLPESVIRQVLIELESDEDEHDLDEEAVAEKGMLETELERRDVKISKAASIRDEDGWDEEVIDDKHASRKTAQGEEAVADMTPQPTPDTTAEAPDIDAEEMVTAFLHHLEENEIEDDRGPYQQLATKKEAAEDLDFNLFEDSAQYSQGQMLSALVTERLAESRPRQLARKEKLISAAADQFRKSMSKVRGFVRVEHVSLNKINSDRVAENGTLVAGSCVFHVILASSGHNRRVGVDMKMSVFDGKPQDDVRLITAGGKQLPLSKKAVEEVMGYRDNRSPVRSTGVERAYHDER